jgi:hypothetical protein
MHACLLVRDLPPYRRGAFEAGLKAIGYEVDSRIRPERDNILVTWNRYSMFDAVARDYERRGGRVLVAENGYLGREWNDKFWYAIGREQHNTMSDFQFGDPLRVDEIGIKCAPWREGGDEIVILETRNIGPESVKEPLGWSRHIFLKLSESCELPVRIRKHPGERKNAIPLEQDLRKARAVVTWGSGGAIKALTWGIPVFYGYDRWIGGEAGHFITLQSIAKSKVHIPRYGEREKTMRRVAWAMWNTEEIERGACFTWLLR